VGHTYCQILGGAPPPVEPWALDLWDDGVVFRFVALESRGKGQ
jgi:hypothetical protein